MLVADLVSSPLVVAVARVSFIPLPRPQSLWMDSFSFTPLFHYSILRLQPTMSDYTSTRDGFQRAMEWSLTGPADECMAFVEGVSTPSFYHIMNGQRLEFDQYVDGVKEWRGKVSDYKPTV